MAYSYSFWKLSCSWVLCLLSNFLSSGAIILVEFEVFFIQHAGALHALRHVCVISTGTLSGPLQCQGSLLCIAWGAFTRLPLYKIPGQWVMQGLYFPGSPSILGPEALPSHHQCQHPWPVIHPWAPTFITSLCRHPAPVMPGLQRLLDSPRSSFHFPGASSCSFLPVSVTTVSFRMMSYLSP